MLFAYVQELEHSEIHMLLKYNTCTSTVLRYIHYFISLYVLLIIAYHRFQSRKHSHSKEIFSSAQIRSLLFRGRMCRFYHFLGLVESAWSKHCYLHHCPPIRQHQIPTSSEGLNLFAIQIKHKEVNSTSFILKHEIAYYVPKYVNHITCISC